ncbi:MAG: radical SAM protein [Clostridia bacterium]|nr:radical SAM protein [Clostridia bacterium]
MSNICQLCPNSCKVNREFSRGRCGEKNIMRIAKYYLHPFEEPFISGTNGSGTVFFSGCALKCVFCQNYELSRSSRGKEITPEELASIFKELEDRGAHNINLVNPTHFLEQISKAFEIYKPNIPVVYNTHGYESIESLEKANSFVDVYLPDLKFYSSLLSKRYTKIENYFEVAEKAIKFMMESKPTVFANGLMKSGVCVRHLILPLGAKDSVEIVKWFSKNAKNGAYLSLMSQYTPFGEINDYPELKRPITKGEYDRVVSTLFDEKIENCLIQERESATTKFIPKWDF